MSVTLTVTCLSDSEHPNKGITRKKRRMEASNKSLKLQNYFLKNHVYYKTCVSLLNDYHIHILYINLNMER